MSNLLKKKKSCLGNRLYWIHRLHWIPSSCVGLFALILKDTVTLDAFISTANKNSGFGGWYLGMQFIERLVALYVILRNFLVVFAAHKRLFCFNNSGIPPLSFSSPAVASDVLRERERTWVTRCSRKGGQSTAGVPLRAGCQVTGGPAARITDLLEGCFPTRLLWQPHVAGFYPSWHTRAKYILVIWIVS